MPDWKENINTIKEIYPGQFQIILDFATNRFVEFALSDLFKYVWVYNHEMQDNVSWEKNSLPLNNNSENSVLLARKLRFDFVLPTKEFKTVLPKLSSGISLIQMNILPKAYLDPTQIKGKTLYDLLTKECDYLCQIEIPSATDYGTIVSSNKTYLQNLLENPGLNWADLP